MKKKNWRFRLDEHRPEYFCTAPNKFKKKKKKMAAGHPVTMVTRYGVLARCPLGRPGGRAGTGGLYVLGGGGCYHCGNVCFKFCFVCFVFYFVLITLLRNFYGGRSKDWRGF